MAITFFGDARQPATDGANSAATNATITPPGSMATNDYVVVFVSAKTTAVTITNSVTGGQTWTAETDAEGSGLSFRTFHCRFNGTWSANPAWSWTNSVPYQVWMVVFRGVDTTTGVDAIDTTPNTFSAPASPFDVTIAASTISTSTTNCMLVACWTSADDNSYTLQTGGWTNPNGQAQWRNAGGTDSSMAVAYMIQAASGNNAAVTNRQSALGGDAGINMILALRPAAVIGPAAGLRTLGLTGCGI